MEWIKSLLDVSKVPAKIVFLVAVISGALLFLPVQLIEILQLLQFRIDFGMYFGIIFIASAGLLIINFVLWTIAKAKSKRAKKKLYELILLTINELDEHEKSVLREFGVQGKNTILMPIDNPTVSGLLHNGILSYVSPNGQITLAGRSFPLKISEFAKEFLTFQQLDFPVGEPSKEDLKKILESRPKWAGKKSFLDQLSDY
jgi:hypothetical protein